MNSMRSKYVGGVLLIVGTSIGAGMLALPVANASLGFWPSTALLIACWFLMTCGALYMAEASLYVNKGQHLLSMAKVTLGKPGIIIAWLSYILLLYALLSAFISGGADVLGGLYKSMGGHLPSWVAITLFTSLFGAVVYQGMRPVDLVNRALMFGKLFIYVALIVLIFPKTDTSFLAVTPNVFNPAMSMILITSFGFAIIVPNLRDYFNADAKALKKVVWIGSLIPLICYILWDAIILGTIPLYGEKGLLALQHSTHTTSDLALGLANVIKSTLIIFLFNLFTSICMLTAFLGVALSLMSFFADGFKLVSTGKEGAFLFLLTFFPPWAIVMFYPGAYLNALSYAGECCVILLLFLPAAMTLMGRAKKKSIHPYVPGGKWLQGFIMLAAVVLLLMSRFGV